MRATASGTHSSTIAKQPASASAHASSASAFAASTIDTPISSRLSPGTCSPKRTHSAPQAPA